LVANFNSGYYGNAKATKDTFSPDGWFMTGDIGRVDDEGFFYVVDRKKELIKYNSSQGPSTIDLIAALYANISF
jgi:long-subunit acyl-CoA synthetase (AMP-forming)